MNDFLEILVDNPNEETSFLLRETIDICKRQGIDISSIDEETKDGEKGLVISTIIIPLAVNVSSTLICEIIKSLANRRTKHRGKNRLAIRTSRNNCIEEENIVEI